MCHQTIGLVQAECERQGIRSVSISLLEEITKKVGSPRVILTPYKLGFPLGEAENNTLQKKILKKMLDFSEVETVEPNMIKFEE